MLILPPVKFRARPRRVCSGKPAGLMLVAAAFTESIGWNLTLTFDRAINIAAMDVTTLVVEAGPNGTIYRGGNTPALIAPQTVRVNMAWFAAKSGPLTLLTASSATRVVAGDGGTWPGVTKVALPFG